MAYDEWLADRIRRVLEDRHVSYEEKRMMGGLCWMIDGKMCCGLLFDRKKELDLIMVRIGTEAYATAIERAGCHPMDFTGRPMKGYAFVSSEGFDSDEDLAYWIDLCLAFNPLAKASKKKTKG